MTENEAARRARLAGAILRHVTEALREVYGSIDVVVQVSDTDALEAGLPYTLTYTSPDSIAPIIIVGVSAERPKGASNARAN